MSTKLEVGKNLAVIAPSVKRPSLTPSHSRFEVRKLSVSDTVVKRIGESDNRSRTSKICYRLADVVMMMVVIFPLTICIWRGVWQLMDYYSEVWEVDPWLSIGVGYAIPFILYLFQEPLKSHVVPGRINFILFYLISKILLLLHAFGSVNQWRGLWKLLDDRTGLGSISAFTTLAVGIVLSVLFRTFSNVLAPPLLCTVDDARSIHDCPLRFKTPLRKKSQYILDCFFSVFVIQSLTVCCWRGLWNLADFYLYPEDAVMSCIASGGFGYILCIILIATQPLVCDFVCNLNGMVRLAVIDLSYMVGFVGCVFAWRGVWNAYNIFLLFDTQNLSEWVTTIVGVVGTILFGCVSTVTARGIAIDGDLEEDEAAEWLIPYISHMRLRDVEIPFPEPWLCRYLCTTQKMNCDKIRSTRRRRRKHQSQDQIDGAAEPLKKSHNSIHPITVKPAEGMPEDDDDKNANPSLRRQNRSNPNPRIRLSQIHHIDSSSEDELGARETMDVNPELNESLESIHSLQEVITMQKDLKK